MRPTDVIGGPMSLLWRCVETNMPTAPELSGTEHEMASIEVTGGNTDLWIGRAGTYNGDFMGGLVKFSREYLTEEGVAVYKTPSAFEGTHVTGRWERGEGTTETIDATFGNFRFSSRIELIRPRDQREALLHAAVAQADSHLWDRRIRAETDNLRLLAEIKTDVQGFVFQGTLFLLVPDINTDAGCGPFTCGMVGTITEPSGEISKVVAGTRAELDDRGYPEKVKYVINGKGIDTGLTFNLIPV